MTLCKYDLRTLLTLVLHTKHEHTNMHTNKLRKRSQQCEYNYECGTTFLLFWLMEINSKIISLPYTVHTLLIPLIPPPPPPSQRLQCTLPLVSVKESNLPVLLFNNCKIDQNTRQPSCTIFFKDEERSWFRFEGCDHVYMATVLVSTFSVRQFLK